VNSNFRVDERVRFSKNIRQCNRSGSGVRTTTLQLLILLLLICFGVLPSAQAVSPPPDGDYPGGNTAEGLNALLELASGTYNTGVGWFSLESVTTGSLNTGVGAGTLALDTASQNTAIGAGALLNNTTGPTNTATGAFALFTNTIGEGNTANGQSALSSNTTAIFNTAMGAEALNNNTTGPGNTAIGGGALQSNTTGGHNTALGYSAGGGLTTGDFNVAVGENAGENLSGSDSNNIDIGYNVVGVAGESNTIRIGNGKITGTYISGISGQTAAGGAAVFVNANGKLGTLTSSKRFKDEIKPMDKASEAIFSLKPVTFRYKKEIDPASTRQFGLVAEEVEKINPDLVVRDETGKVNSVRYEQVNAMLLNEFLKEHRKVQEQEAAIAQLKSTVTKQEEAIAQLRKDFETTIAEVKRGMETVVARFKEQDAKIQRVSEQIDLSKPAPRTASNDR
jgi:endosialidase-like protein